MRSKNLLLVVGMWLFALGLTNAYAQGEPDLLNSPIGVSWARLSLEAYFPKPFGKVVIVVKQSKENFDPKITGIEISFNGHKLSFQKSLLKGLVLADDPEIGYHTKGGKISSIFIFFQYGYPIRQKTGCGASDCVAYPVAEFVIDKEYHVTRNDNILPVD
ncbi:MAG: hypothetical protein ACRD4Q_04620 [Candidatus Acidiferrales bacterium]